MTSFVGVLIPKPRRSKSERIIRGGARDARGAFARTARLPFDYRRLTDRADAAWKAAG